ncbi:MAG: trypsin-like peptidase domain-containing protein [Deltaproteobacteria bacterium]
MPGVTFEEITSEVVDAYDEDELKDLLKKRMNVRLDVIVARKPFGHMVSDLLQWTERRGRESELIRVAAQARPEHAGMQAIYKKYGMALPLSVQANGETIPAAPADASDAGLERIVRDDLKFLDFAVWRERMTRVEGQVCRVKIDGQPAGTGFLVGPDAILTNFHVLQSILDKSTPATVVECQFDYKVLADRSRNEGIVAHLHPQDWYVDHSPYTPAEADGAPDRELPTTDQLDYALVRLADSIGNQPSLPNSRPGEPDVPRRGWIAIPQAAPVFAARMPLLIVQHPEGSPLKLAIDSRAIDQQAGLGLNSNGTRVRYATNTESGSSGSPVFDQDWRLVALHHYGDPAYNHPPRYNQGIPIAMIRQRIERSGKAQALGRE